MGVVVCYAARVCKDPKVPSVKLGDARLEGVRWVTRDHMTLGIAEDQPSRFLYSFRYDVSSSRFHATLLSIAAFITFPRSRAYTRAWSAIDPSRQSLSHSLWLNPHQTIVPTPLFLLHLLT